MRTVYLVRHGDTMDNAATPGPELERGWCRIGLAEMGRKEARRTGKKLVDLKVNALVSSDLARARQSAKIIGDAIGIEPDFHSQLRTWNLGNLTGKPQAVADKEAARLVRNAPDRVPPGGESFEQFCRRVFAALSDILANHEGKIALVIHANVERLFEAWRAAGEKPDHAISANVFLAKPEQPGHIEEWRVDPAAVKLSHEQADYEEHKQDMSNRDYCAMCKAYRGHDKCTKVAAPIDEDDWCAVGVGKSGGHWFAGNDKLKDC